MTATPHDCGCHSIKVKLLTTNSAALVHHGNDRNHQVSRKLVLHSARILVSAVPLSGAEVLTDTSLSHTNSHHHSSRSAQAVRHGMCATTLSLNAGWTLGAQAAPCIGEWAGIWDGPGS